MEATASELQYLQEHIGDSRVSGVIISSVICGFVTCICVALRFLARFVSRAGVGKDDYCIILGLVSLRLLLLVDMWEETLTINADLVPFLHHHPMYRDRVRSRTACPGCDEPQDAYDCEALISPLSAHPANTNHSAYPLRREHLRRRNFTHQVLYSATLPPRVPRDNLSKISRRHGSDYHGLGACGLLRRHIYMLSHRIPMGYVHKGHLHRLWKTYIWYRSRQCYYRLHLAGPPPPYTLEASYVYPAKGPTILYSWGRQLVSLLITDHIIYKPSLYASELI